MQLPTSLLSLLCLVLPNFELSAARPAPPPLPHSPSPQSVLYETISQDTIAPSGLSIPTRYESTVLARRLLALSSTGILSTVFPQNITSPYIPHSVANTPIGLPEYLASCEPSTHPGSPTLLALKISTSTRNALAGSNSSLTLSWWDTYTKLTHSEPWSAANLPRVNLVGWLEEISKKEVESQRVVECFTGVHGDSKWWLPGDKGAAHEGVWMRLVVEEIYWIGGFGNQAFIGWFDVDEWRSVTERDWQSVRLPGEKA